MPNFGAVCVLATVANVETQVVPSKEYSPLYVVPVFVRRSQKFVVPVGTAVPVACGCGFWVAPACSERSSIRLIRVWLTSEIASSLT